MSVEERRESPSSGQAGDAESAAGAKIDHGYIASLIAAGQSYVDRGVAGERRRNMTPGVYPAGLIPSISRPVPRRSRPLYASAAVRPSWQQA